MERVAFATLGCKVNQYETEGMMELFKNSGYKIVDFEEFADVYVINTCTVTSFGDKKSRQMIRRAKNRNNDAIIAVVGCYSQVSPESVFKIPGVDIVLGTNDRRKLVDYVKDYKDKRVPIKHVGNIMNVREFEELKIDEYRGRTRAFLKVQDGCNMFCSYCLIPYARGPIRSRDPEMVMDEVVKLADAGFKEIILAGIHVASFGKDLHSGINLVDIIEKIQGVDGIERIRIGSVEPRFFSDGVISRLKNVPKLCRHFHLSLQSGCNETLKRMNRHYTAEQYKDIVEKLRESFPGVSITTDVIVGFPGETEEEFSKTYSFLEDLKLSKTHIFKYSPREGTPAAKFPDAVPPQVKERRSSLLLKLNEINESKFIEKFINSEAKVLYEQTVNDMEGYIEGYTDNYINVRSPGDISMTGKIINSAILKNCGEFALGKLL